MASEVGASGSWAGQLEPENANLVVEGLGDLQFMSSIEWRSHWVSPWDLASFVDAGNIWLHGSDAPAETRWVTRDGAAWPWVLLGRPLRL